MIKRSGQFRNGEGEPEQEVMGVLFAEMLDDLWEKSMLIIVMGLSLTMMALGMVIVQWRTGSTFGVVIGTAALLLVLFFLVREVRDFMARGRS